MAILGMLKSIIHGKQIPGSPGFDSAAASVAAYTSPVILYVTTAGTFSFKTSAGTTRTSVPLPVGVYPCYLDEITAIADGGVGEVIYQ